MQVTDAQVDQDREPSANVREVSAPVAWALLLTSIVVGLLGIVFIVNVGRAESLQKLPDARHWLSAGGVVLVLFGAGLAAMAIFDIAKSGRWIARVLAIWLWISAICVAVGGIIGRHHPHGWPWPELILGIILALVATAVVNLRRRQRRARAIRYLSATDR